MWENTSREGLSRPRWTNVKVKDVVGNGDGDAGVGLVNDSRNATFDRSCPEYNVRLFWCVSVAHKIVDCVHACLYENNNFFIQKKKKRRKNKKRKIKIKKK